MAQPNDADRSGLPQIGARVPPGLRTDIERIAHSETDPGSRNVKPSHVVRAAIRLYVEQYESDGGDLDPFEEGGL